MIKKILFYCKKYQLFFEFFAITLFILFPVLKNGYILLLDNSFTPKIKFDHNWAASTLPWNLLEILFIKIFGSIIVEKMIYIVIVLLILFGAYRFVKTSNVWVRYFAAFFYLFNPFVYSRFLYGHLLVLLAYALLPFLFRSFLDLLDNPNFKKSLLVVFYTLLISIFDIRFVLFIFLSFLIIYIIFILSHLKDKTLLKSNMVLAVKMLILFFVFSSYWLVPIFLGRSEVNNLINTQIDDRHLKAFRTASDQKYGVVLNTAAMYGFWGDREGRYAVQKDMVHYWFELYGLILLIILWGAFCGLKKPETRSITLSFIFIGIISLVLAVGVAYSPFEQLILWLNKYFSFYKGYREPQKWVAILILSYVYLGSLGVGDLIFRIQNKIKNHELKVNNSRLKFISFYLKKLSQIIPALFIIIPLLYSPGMLAGFRGQMQVSNYPISWFKVNDILNRDQDVFKTLFLPWHQYMYFDFAGKVIANPAVNFFDRPILAGDNIEMGAIYTQNSNPDSQYIEKEILYNKKRNENIGDKLMKLNIKYVIFVKEADFLNYEFINKQNDLKKIYEQDKIVVYKNLKWVK